MTITQRIELRRLGYSKEEIAELAEQEKIVIPEAPETTEAEQSETVPVEAPAQNTTNPNINEQLLYAINNLTTVLQTQKLNQTAQPELKQETVQDIFNNLLN